MKVGMPMARMTPARQFQGVKSDRRYARPVMPIRIFSLNQCAGAVAAVTVLDMVVPLLLGSGRGGLLGGVGVAALRERVEPHEQRRPERHDEGRSAERALHLVRVRLVAD